MLTRLTTIQGQVGRLLLILASSILRFHFNFSQIYYSLIYWCLSFYLLITLQTAFHLHIVYLVSRSTHNWFWMCRIDSDIFGCSRIVLIMISRIDSTWSYDLQFLSLNIILTMKLTVQLTFSLNQFCVVACMIWIECWVCKALCLMYIGWTI